MADNLQYTPEERHSNKVLFYINWTTGAILLIVICVFFFPVPKVNEKFVDIGLGILLGILSSNSGTVTGNSPTSKKPDITVSGDSPQVTNNPIITTDENK